MRFLLLLSVLLTFTLFGQNHQAKGTLDEAVKSSKGNTHIILIGVSEYENLEANKQLNYADDDTELMKGLFETWDNVNIKSFINKEADRNAVGMAIHNTLNKEAVEGDRVIIYFSGHGDVDKAYGDGYLLLNKVTEPNDQIYQFSDALSLNQLETMMNKAANNGVDVLLITDACKSGSVENARDANQRMLNIGSNTSSMVSCGPSELSYESVKYGGGHGVFTYYLAQGLMGLADNNDDKTITFKELSRYVEDKVSEAQEGNQNPMSRGLPTKEISDVNPELAAKAEQQEDLTLAMATLESGKSFDPLSKGAGSSAPLIVLLQKLVHKGIFFEDELSGSKDASIRLNDQATVNISSNSIHDITTNNSGSLVAATTNNSVVIYSPEHKLLKTFKGHKSGVTAAAFHPTSNNLISCSWGNDAVYWNASTGTIIRKQTRLTDEVKSIVFMNSTTAAMGNNRGDLYIWDLSSDHPAQKISVAKKSINDIEFDGKYLYLACSDGKIYRLDPTTKKVTSSSKAHGSATSLAIAPISEFLLSVGNDKKLRAWKLKDLNEAYSIPLDYDDNREIQVDLFENYCFVGSRRYDLDVIDLKNKKLIKRFANSQNGLVSVAFNASSNQLYFGDSKGRLYFNDLTIENGSFSALQIHKMLIDNPENEAIDYKIDGTVIVGLNNYVASVLNPLVNGKAILPGMSEILKAKRYAEKALELGGKYKVDKIKLEINLLLLEVFEILQGKKDDQFEAALSNIDRISALDPNGAYAYNISGALLSELHEFADAKKKASRAEVLAPAWAEATCGSGKILFKEGDYAGAEQKFKETIVKGPELSKGYYHLGMLYTHLGRFEEGAENLDKAMKIDEGVESFIAERIKNGLYTGDLAGVKRLVNTNLDKDFAAVLIAKADIEFLEARMTSNYQGLYDLYSKALSLDTNNIDALNALAYFYLRIKNDKKAKDFIDEHFSDPKSDRPLNSKTLLKRETKLLFNRVKRLDRKNIRAEIGSWMLRSSEVDKSSVENLINRHEESAEAYAAVGTYYLFADNPKMALKYLKKGMAADPSDYRCYVLSMEANTKMGKSSKNLAIQGDFKRNVPESDALKFKDDIVKIISPKINKDANFGKKSSGSGGNSQLRFKKS